MSTDAARIRAAAAFAFAVVAAFYLATAPPAPLWPAETPATAVALHVRNVLTAIPLGDAPARPGRVAAVLGGLAAALTAALIARRGAHLWIAVTAAVAVAFGLSPWTRGVSGPSVTLAMLLISAAAFVADARPRSRGTAIGVAIAIVCAAAVLDPVALLAAPIVAAWAWGASTRVTTVAGAVAAGALFALSAPPTGENVVHLVRDEWLLGGTLIVAAAALAPVWGHTIRSPSLAGTAVGAVAFVLGHDASTVAIFLALLIADVIGGLSVATAWRAVILCGLAVTAAADRLNAPAADSWRLLAWRDAVEHALPQGAVIATNVPAVAALSRPLFANRASGVSIHLADDDGLDAEWVLEHLGEPTPSGVRVLARVPVTFARPADVIVHLPAGTIVGLAATSRAAADAQGFADALAVVGQPPLADAGVVVGVVGAAGASRPQERHRRVLLGEALDAAGQRSPVDLELVADDGAAGIRLRGRDLVSGTAWALVLVDSHGRLLDAFASNRVPAAIELRMPGLGLWRSEARASRILTPARGAHYD